VLFHRTQKPEYENLRSLTIVQINVFENTNVKYNELEILAKLENKFYFSGTFTTAGIYIMGRC
jgi:hypothetical protein